MEDHRGSGGRLRRLEEEGREGASHRHESGRTTPPRGVEEVNPEEVLAEVEAEYVKWKKEEQSRNLYLEGIIDGLRLGLGKRLDKDATYLRGLVEGQYPKYSGKSQT